MLHSEYPAPLTSLVSEIDFAAHGGWEEKKKFTLLLVKK